MDLQALRQRLEAGAVDSLELLSLEGGIYLLQVCEQGQRQSLRDVHGAVLRLRSVEHAREYLQGLPQRPLFLLQNDVHDQMCGMPAAAREPLRVAIGWDPAW